MTTQPQAPRRTTVIRSSGMYVPPDVYTNDMLARLMDTSDEWIVQRTGIRERRFAPAGTGSAALGIEAARRAGMEWIDVRSFHTPERLTS